MGLFSPAQAEKISNAAAKSAEALKTSGPAINVKSINSDLQAIEKQVEEYFSDSPAILITTKQEFHDYVSKCIEYGYAGTDTETTGLDRIRDYIVGWSLYVPGMPEAYIPCKHLTPIFDTPRPDQLTYEECGEELQRLVDAGVHLILANADFDTAMIYKDFRVDIKDNVYYDVLLAWRCIKEDEKDNTLKGLYAKYPMHGQVDPKKFSDFFPVKLFPYCRPEIAKLYAANDAKITFDLFLWQVVYITKSNPKCQKAHLEKIADLFWNVEIPMTRVCAMLHRTGMYIDNWTANKLQKRYNTVLTDMQKSIAAEVQTIIDEKDFAANRKRPFRTGADFNPNSTPQVKYLLSDLLGLDMSKGTGKEILAEYKNIKIVSMILDYRSLDTVISTFVIKLPKAVARDQRIHGSFKQIGASTGRMASENPNLQNIPSHRTDIRHLFRGTPQKVEKVTVSESKVKLWEIDQIKTSENQWVYVKDVAIGSQCVVVDELEHLVITSISDIVHPENSKECVLTFSRNCSLIFVKKPVFVVMSSDYSQQEPKLTAFAAQERKMINAFQNGKDIYATIASIAYNVPYEECLEFNPVTHALQPDGKARRSVGKVLVLGLNYGMTVQSIGQDLFAGDDSLTDEQKTKKAQEIFDAVMKGFPDLANAIKSAQAKARKLGYTETILGRRRHHPNMQLPEYEILPMKGYVNPDVDPLDPSTFAVKDAIPDRIVADILKRLKACKYYGAVVKLTKQLAAENIKVVNNSYKIQEASRQVWNAVVQGSAADLTKLAMIKLTTDPEWVKYHGRLLVPVHDELICEIPYEYREKGEEILSRCMVEAGNFLPFAISCDVTTTFRWYGVEVNSILSYDKPESLNKDTLTDSNVKWLQAALYESEYLLPIIKDENGKKPSGDAALGINGIWSQEMDDAIQDYRTYYQLKTDQEFLDHIERKTIYGVTESL